MFCAAFFSVARREMLPLFYACAAVVARRRSAAGDAARVLPLFARCHDTPVAAFAREDVTRARGAARCLSDGAARRKREEAMSVVARWRACFAMRAAPRYYAPRRNMQAPAAACAADVRDMPAMMPLESRQPPRYATIELRHMSSRLRRCLIRADAAAVVHAPAIPPAICRYCR